MDAGVCWLLVVKSYTCARPISYTCACPISEVAGHIAYDCGLKQSVIKNTRSLGEIPAQLTYDGVKLCSLRIMSIN